MLNPSIALVAGAMCTLASIASAQPTALFTQAMLPGGGTLRPSQLWVDPTGQNDLDSDAIAWEDFMLAEASTVTRVEWWGQALPPQGFRIGFYHQDPNTIAVQPDLFRPESAPISVQTYPTPMTESAGGALVHFTVDLAMPVTFQANTRYFVSVVGLTPIAYATWGWAASAGAGTFYWSRGAHMYFSMPENRALVLSGVTPPLPSCAADINGDGRTNSTDFNILVSHFGNTVIPYTNGDFTGDGVVNSADFNILAGDYECALAN